MVIILLKFPEYAIECINTLTDNGFEAYFVGGCVRDTLLNKACDDIDITTNALPNHIMSIFPHTIPTGIKHGTVTVVHKDKKIEITTYRTENRYTDNRHPDNVNFVSDLNEDLSRRDFTINALACSKDYQIVDIFNGITDLENRIIRAVGNPEKRFEEDALRIIRAYRFSSVLGFEIEENTNKSATKLSKSIKNISGERILKELMKSVGGVRPSAFCELLNTYALESFGITNPLFSNDIFDRISDLHIAEEDKLAIFISLCQHNTELLISRLKLSKSVLSNINSLDLLIFSEIPKNKTQIKYLLYKYGEHHIKLYFHYLKTTKKVSDNSLFQLLDEIIQCGEAYKISHLNIDGNELIQMGITGAEIGKTLENILFLVIEEILENSKESILSYLKLNHQ